MKPLWVARTISVILALAALNAGGAAAVGAWRGRSWAPWMTVVYGAVTAGMIVSLGPMLSLNDEARKGLLSGGVVVLVFCAAMAWGLRWAQIRRY